MDKNKSRTDMLAAGRKKVFCFFFCFNFLLFLDYKCLVDENPLHCLCLTHK